MKERIIQNLDNLYQNKIIYHEKRTIIATLKNIGISNNGFSATLIKEQTIYNPRILKSCNYNSWDISFNWNNVNYQEKGQKIIVPYACFKFWTAPSLVKYIEKLVNYGDINDALKILHSN